MAASEFPSGTPRAIKKGMKAAVFTIIAKNYLPYARVLMASIRAASPQLKRIVVLADRPDSCFDPREEDFEVILSEELGIPNSLWFHFKYTTLELSTAVKPYAAQRIFECYGVERLLYLDPDIFVYSDLEPILSALETRAILLTPHLTAPLEDDRRPSDLDILRAGAYNLGFLGLRLSDTTGRFLSWWQNKLYDQCLVDLPKGLFVDQKWIDLVPGLFDGVGILRDPGLNVAYWNLAHRTITQTTSGYLVEGRPLMFFHFSGFDPDNPHAFSRHQNRFRLDDLGAGRDLVTEYRGRLYKSGYAECAKWPNSFGSFANGFPIPEMGRSVHHEAPSLLESVADPFSDEGFREILKIWNAPLAGPDGKPTGVTRLAYRVYRARADVQAAMPDLFNGDLLRFLTWMRTRGKVEHSLSDALIAPISDALGASRHSATSRRGSGLEKQHESIVNERIIQTLLPSDATVREGDPVHVDVLNSLTGNGNAKVHLTYLARAIYEARPDLQQYFPDPCRQDGLRFVVWFLTYGAREYKLAEVLCAPLRRQWRDAVAALDSPLQRVWHRAIYAGAASSMHLRERWTRLASRMRLLRHPSIIKLSHFLPGKQPAAADGLGINLIPTPIAGVNLIGYTRSEMGVGESARCSIRAASSCNLGVAVKSVDKPGPYRRRDRSAGREDPSCPYPVNLVHVNADQCESVLAELGEEVTRGRYNIGCWAWELAVFPRRWQRAFDHFDEIWTLSSFSQTAIAQNSPVAVVRMPPAIAVEEVAAVDRSSFSIGPEEFVFLGIIDLLSVPERKNALGLLAAFRNAFPATSHCRLILKINHGKQRPAEIKRIAEAADGLRVTVIDRTIDRPEVNGLIQMSDSVVSLHRSEGFGLPLAEAMYLGKPVVATAYSGNLDFTTPDNSFLVEYDLVPIPSGCAPYDKGLLWAEPRMDSAVAQLRTVAAGEELRATRGGRAQEYVRTHFSPRAVGELMVARLRVVESRRARGMRVPVEDAALAAGAAGSL